MPILQPTFEIPQREGEFTTSLNFVSTIRHQTFTGQVDSNAVDMQVSLNGGPFESDPALVEFDEGEFHIPNQNVFPEGFRFDFGTNTVRVRAIGPTGEVSESSSVSVQILREENVTLVSEAPTGLSVRRRQDAVEVVWAANDIPFVRGYNVYASSQPSGGSQGYVRINRDLITNPSFQEEDKTERRRDSTFFTHDGGRLRVFLSQEDFEENPIDTVMDSALDLSLLRENLEVDVILSEVETTTFYSFVHNRSDTVDDGTINNERFADVPDDEPLYYVMTAVMHDPSTGQEIESFYSAELVGLPLTIDTQSVDMPRRDRFDVSEDFIGKIFEFDPTIALAPGSVSRDIIIDPFSSEVERLYFVADFVRRAQSVSSLLVVDDLESYKESLGAALGITNIENVQDLIDDAFEKHAGNVNLNRRGAEAAVGTVTFYASSEPTEDLVVNEGALVSTAEGAPTFRVTSRVTLPADQSTSFFNRQRNRWEVQANVRATEPGDSGNVPAGRITSVVGGVSGLQVENLEATTFGRDQESNQDLAERTLLAFASVDVGTERGYLSTALRQKDVFRASVVKAGHDFMHRDYDEVRDKNIGGKVDLWVQGDRTLQVSDRFALSFDVSRDVRFFLDSDPSDYIFVVDDDRITPDQPILQMLGETPQEQAQGFRFHNLTTGQTFDLTDYQVIDFNRIQLQSAGQPSVGINDVIIGDVRFRDTAEFFFTRQPAWSVDSVSSLETGDVLDEGVHYQFFMDQDPLLEGYSTGAETFIELRQDNDVPSGDLISVNDERHILVGQVSEALDQLGVRPFSVRVFSLDRQTEYDGPLSADPDFFVEEGDATTPVEIIRNPDGNIANGEEVSVDYDHDENFEVTYAINDLLNSVQHSIDINRHITADVLVKQAIPNPIDLEMTIVLRPGASVSRVDSEVRTNITQLLNSKPMGSSVHQSDIVKEIEAVSGVSHVVMPFSRLTHQDGNLIMREPVNNASSFLEQVGNISVYVLQDSLEFNTSLGGGEVSRHRGVFEDTLPLNLVDSYASLRGTSDSALIVGRGGLVVPGYSDNQTLEDDGYLTADAKEQRRRELTSNRIFLALSSGESPQENTYHVSYQVEGDQSSRSTIQLNDVTNAELGDLTITYDEN